MSNTLLWGRRSKHACNTEEIFLLDFIYNSEANASELYIKSRINVSEALLVAVCG